MIRKCLLMAMFLFSTIANANNKVRKVIVFGDQIVTVKTALGIATIIEVPDRPNSVVVGDQEAFKVEYLDQAVTIKPLQFGAKTNIYIYTDWKRYNVELISGPENVSDYVVYLENPKEKNQVSVFSSTKNDSIKWFAISGILKNGDLTLKISRAAKLKNGILEFEFLLISGKKQTIKPEWIWITQKNKTKPINNLILSSIDISPNSSVQGFIQVLLSDIDTNEQIRIEVRRNGISYLTIKKVDLWK